MTTTFPTLPGFAYNGDRIDCLLREFPNGHTMVITSQDGVSLPERGDWLACYYPGDWREDIEVEETGTWSNEDDFCGDPDFLFDLVNDIAHGMETNVAARHARLRSDTCTVADARAFIAEEMRNALPCPDLGRAMASIIIKHWAATIGIGFHIDTDGADYSPALPADQVAIYDADMLLVLAATEDAYAVALEVFKELGLIDGKD